MNQLLFERPTSAEYAPPFEKYVSRVPEADALGALAGQKADLAATLAEVRGEAERYRYAEGKWSIREVVGHLIDAERVFGYRAVCIARGEVAALPGFDENAYVANASFDECPLTELLDEFALVRDGHLAFFRHLRREAWLRSGVANAKATSVRALAYIMAGHPRHHLAILRERYLPHLRA